MPEASGPAAKFAAAIADDERRPWDGVRDAGSTAGDRELLNQLQIISAVRRAHRGDGIHPSGEGLRPLLATAGWFVLLLAAVKIAAGTAGVPAAVWPPGAGGSWLLALNLLLFGLSGAVLALMSGRDPRIRALAGVFLIIGAAFADPLLPRIDPTLLGAPVAALRHAPPEAFLPAAFWMFVQRFPAPAQDPVVRRTGDLFLAGSLAAGVALFAANLAIGVSRVTGQAPFAGLTLFDSQAPALAFWPVLFGVMLPAIPFLVWKAGFDALETRRRVRFFIGAIGVAVTPMLIAVIVSPWIPALAEPEWRKWTGIVLYAALLSLVPSTVYAVAVQRVMDLGIAVHKTMQHRLARNTVGIVTVAPLAYLIGNLYEHRDTTITALFSGGRSIALLMCSLVGLGMLTFRHTLMTRVDRWFEFDEADHGQMLARLERRFRAAPTAREMLDALAEEIDALVRPTVIGVLLVSESADELLPAAGEVGPLKHGGAIVDLLRSVPADVQLSVRERPIFQLLPDHDRRWLTAAGILELFPLIGSNGTLLGVVALGAPRIAAPYTPHHRTLIASATAAASLRLENLWLRERPAEEGAGRHGGMQPVSPQDEPAAYCRSCFTVLPPRRARCRCGSQTIAAAIPLILQGKFRLVRFIGSGGMGVVYLGVDLTLQRKVAIKTLPAMMPARAERLQREAQAMATVVHPHLATVFGAEQWRGTPLLIMEYLEGGTLADRLRHGPLSVEQMIDLGVVLADVLDRVHDSGVLHRDIKPSNVGYTRDGLPKLLDFGLAAILDRSNDEAPWVGMPVESSLAAELLEARPPGATLTLTHQVIGTPLYLAPEAAAGHPPHVSFDLWSLCLMLYEALAGEHPFGGGSTRQVLARLARFEVGDIRKARPACESTVAQFFADALARVPQRRPSTARDLRNRLQLLRANLPPSGPDRGA